ncbi:MAG TPA: MarR family winged helix-turn-helix transcriptional regulator [Ktedonobacterales bacterium]|nr:MarR family winged helix-turn-helix transcriptional regulator [Ktedonobacterales bacterium]
MTKQSTPYDSLMIGALLKIPVQVLDRRVAAALAERGFTDYRPTYQPVFQWCRPEGSRLTELAERIGVTKQSMGEIIDVLEQRGYVERVPDPTDGRAVLIRRTERGWQVNRIARQVVEETQQEWRQALGEEPLAHLLDALRQLAAVLDEPVGAGGHPEANKPATKNLRASPQVETKPGDL